MKPLSRASTRRVKPPAPQPPPPPPPPLRVLSRAKSSPNLLLGLTAAADSDSLINLNADSDKPSKSRRKVAEMIDDLNVALGLKKADAERLEKKRKKQEAKERQKGIIGHLLHNFWVLPRY